MRNLFDQYKQPENKLTHALISTLHNDRKLIRPFLQWLDVTSIPPTKEICVGEQQLPGAEAETEKEGEEGLPDGCFWDDKGWATLIEAKVQAGISISQLQRHCEASKRYGYGAPYMVLLSVDSRPRTFPSDRRFCHCEWREVYEWFCGQTRHSGWAKRFIEYMQVFESKMLAEDYGIRGTLTMFTGFRFSEEDPYTYEQGKRLIRLMRREFFDEKKRLAKRLVKELRIDLKGEGRSKLTKSEDGAVWDVIPLKAACGKGFTAFPHLTMVVRPSEADVAVMIPNGIKGGIKRRLQARGIKGFADLLAGVEANLRKTIKEVEGAKPFVGIVQRHYKSRLSLPEIDGQIEVDLRTLLEGRGASPKHQPGWLEAIYGVLAVKKTNIQMGVGVHLPYAAKVMQSVKAIDKMAEAWIALKPLIEFAQQ